MSNVKVVYCPAIKKFDINLIVNVGGDGARTMRVGEGSGPSKCILHISHPKEIDSIIDRLLEIRNML